MGNNQYSILLPRLQLVEEMVDSLLMIHQRFAPMDTSMQGIMANGGKILCHGAAIEARFNVIESRLDLYRDLVIAINDFRCLPRAR